MHGKSFGMEHGAVVMQRTFAAAAFPNAREMKRSPIIERNVPELRQKIATFHASTSARATLFQRNADRTCSVPERTL